MSEVDDDQIDSIDVFLSYRRTERARVEVIAQSLEELGLSVWFDAELSAGDDFRTKINRSLSVARCVLVCWTAGARSSKWVNAEALAAWEKNKLVAAFLEPVELETPFNIVHTEDLGAFLGDIANEPWQKLTNEIGRRVGRPGLGDLLAARVKGTPAALGAWADGHRSDPLASSVQADAEALADQLKRKRAAEELEARLAARSVASDVRSHSKSEGASRALRLSTPGPKRILAIEGAGTKVLLTLGLLEGLEAELRKRTSNPNATLSDYYDLIGGSSAGAMVASMLCLGMPISDIVSLIFNVLPSVFGRTTGDGVFLQSRYDASKLRRALSSVFGTRTLGSEDLVTGLALITKRIDTGTLWVVSNNPRDRYFDVPSDSLAYPNKRLRLIDLVLASMASPTFFDEVVLDIAHDDRRRPIEKAYFIDGSAGGAANPSLHLLQLVLAPSGGFQWASGPDQLLLTSVGCGSRRPRVDGKSFAGLPPGLRGVHALRSMTFDTQITSINLLQGMSRPRTPWFVDAERNEVGLPMISPTPLLDFQRLDVALEMKAQFSAENALGRSFTEKELEDLDFVTNARPANLNLLFDLGRSANRWFVGSAYPPPQFDS